MNECRYVFINMNVSVSFRPNNEFYKNYEQKKTAHVA